MPGASRHVPSIYEDSIEERVLGIRQQDGDEERTAPIAVDKKYIYKVVALPKDVGARLAAVSERLSVKVGFKVSAADTIAWLLKQVEEQVEEPK